MYIFQRDSHSSSHPLLPLLYPQVHFLHLCLYSCPVNMFISTICLDSIFSSVAQSCLTLCDALDHSTPGFPVHHQLPEPTQTHVYCISDAIQPSHPLSSPSPPAFNLSRHQGPFQWVGFWRQVTKVLDFQLHHQSFQWIFRTDFL